jgi:hypothetical protein
MLNAAHSINLKPDEAWVSQLMSAAVSPNMLPQYRLVQVNSLLSALVRLKQQPEPEWLLVVAQHVAAMVAADQQESSTEGQQQRPAAVNEAAADTVTVEMTTSGGSSSRDLHRPVHHPVNQQQQPKQQQQWRTAHIAASRPISRQMLCLYIWLMAAAVQLSPEQSRAELRRALQPSVVAAAKHAAAALDRLDARPLVQLVVGLWGLQCRPGPAFIAAHMARCEAIPERFRPQYMSKLLKAYAGLGCAPSQPLLALMVAHSSYGDEESRR